MAQRTMAEDLLLDLYPAYKALPSRLEEALSRTHDGGTVDTSGLERLLDQLLEQLRRPLPAAQVDLGPLEELVARIQPAPAQDLGPLVSSFAEMISQRQPVDLDPVVGAVAELAEELRRGTTQQPLDLSSLEERLDALVKLSGGKRGKADSPMFSAVGGRAATITNADGREAAVLGAPATGNEYALGVRVVSQPASTGQPNLTGTPKYYSGAAGTVTPAVGERIMAVTCHATSAGTVTIFGGASIPVPANSTFFDSTDGQWVGDGTKTIVFSGTDSYYVRIYT